MKVAGVDFDSHRVDVVTLTVMGPLRMQWFRGVFPANGKAWDATKLVRAELEMSVSWRDVHVVYIEKPFTQSRATLAGLSCIQGAIAASLPNGVIANEISAQGWKGLLLGKPSASKQEVERFLRELGFDTLPDEHAWDALGIAYAARTELRRESDRLRSLEKKKAVVA